MVVNAVIMSTSVTVNGGRVLMSLEVYIMKIFQPPDLTVSIFLFTYKLPV